MAVAFWLPLVVLDVCDGRDDAEEDMDGRGQDAKVAAWWNSGMHGGIVVRAALRVLSPSATPALE
jgi:hypothetical protein